MSKKEKLVKVLTILGRICWCIIGGISLAYIVDILRAKRDKLDAETEFYSSQARFTQKLNCKEDD